MPPGARPPARSPADCQNWWPDCTGTGAARCVGRPCGVDGIDSDAPGGMVDVDPSDVFAERALGNLTAHPAAILGPGSLQARQPGSREWPGGVTPPYSQQNPYGADPGDPGVYAQYDGTSYMADRERDEYGNEYNQPYDQYGPDPYGFGGQGQYDPGDPNQQRGNGDYVYEDQGHQAAAPPPSPAPRPARHTDGDTWLRIVGGSLELMKSVSWIIQLWKLIGAALLLENEIITALVALNFSLATLIQLQKPFDQIMLVIAAQNRYHRYGFQSLGPMGFCCMCACCPLSFPLLGLSNVTLKIYGLERIYHYEPGDLLVFAHRPLSTVFLGLPVANIMSMISADRALVLHPVQVHIRAMQSVYQMFFEYLITIVIDIVTILSASGEGIPLGPEVTIFGPEVLVFWVSFCFAAISIFVNCGVVSIVTVRAEKARMQKRTMADPNARGRHLEFATTPPNMLPGWHGTGF